MYLFVCIPDHRLTYEPVNSKLATGANQAYMLGIALPPEVKRPQWNKQKRTSSSSHCDTRNKKMHAQATSSHEHCCGNKFGPNHARLGMEDKGCACDQQEVAEKLDKHHMSS